MAPKKKKKKKQGVAAVLPPLDDPADESMAKAKAKAKDKGTPTIKFKLSDGRYQCFYNKLPCKSFPFKNKKDRATAKQAAEDISGVSVLISKCRIKSFHRLAVLPKLVMSS